MACFISLVTFLLSGAIGLPIQCTFGLLFNSNNASLIQCHPICTEIYNLFANSVSFICIYEFSIFDHTSILIYIQ